MGNSTNAGFAGVMTPMGLFLLGLFFFLLVAIIAFGSAWIKAGEARDREMRRHLKEKLAAKEEKPG